MPGASGSARRLRVRAASAARPRASAESCTIASTASAAAAVPVGDGGGELPLQVGQIGHEQAQDVAQPRLADVGEEAGKSLRVPHLGVRTAYRQSVRAYAVMAVLNGRWRARGRLPMERGNDAGAFRRAGRRDASARVGPPPAMTA